MKKFVFILCAIMLSAFTASAIFGDRETTKSEKIGYTSEYSVDVNTSADLPAVEVSNLKLATSDFYHFENSPGATIVSETYPLTENRYRYCLKNKNFKSTDFTKFNIHLREDPVCNVGYGRNIKIPTRLNC